MNNVKPLLLDASKPTRNGFVHPYVPNSSSLIVIGAPLDCETAAELIDTARNNPNKSEQLEITRVVVAHTDPVCFKSKDAKAD